MGFCETSCAPSPLPEIGKSVVPKGLPTPPERWAEFFESLRDLGSITAAAAAVGVGASSVRKEQERTPGFKEKVEEAREHYRETQRQKIYDLTHDLAYEKASTEPCNPLVKQAIGHLWEKWHKRQTAAVQVTGERPVIVLPESSDSVSVEQWAEDDGDE